ncbi:hypothetical protein LTS08_008725 [Lithohypha guttulata]|nr:hypothetical protein LTS08_008725 [Lithohypha guttulata]
MTILKSNIPAKAKCLPRGVYPPCITLFKPTARQEIDTDACYAHYSNLIRGGVAGLVVQGTNGEAVLLSPEEKIELTRTARKAAADLNLPDYAIVAGISGQSTNETLKLAADAAEAGASFALLLPPSFWPKAATNDVLRDFYREVADESPIPVVIYNYPGATNGVDLSSVLLAELAEHPNIVGVKLTCGNAGKVTHLSELFSPEQFSVYAGQVDWLLPCLIGGGVGCITGMGNIFPRAVSKIYTLWEQNKIEEAKRLQGAASAAEKACREGIALTKYGAWKFEGPRIGFNDPATYFPRKPYKPLSKDRQVWCIDTLQHMSDIEDSLPDVVVSKRGATNGV